MPHYDRLLIIHILGHYPLVRHPIPADIYLLKVNNRNTRTRCEICSNLKVKTPERRHWRFGVFIVTLNVFHTLF